MSGDLMFATIKSLLMDLGAEKDEAPAFADDDHRVAAAALMVHVVSIDGIVSDDEEASLRKVLKNNFELEDAQTDELIAIAQRRERDAVDLYRFTSILKRTLDEDGKKKIIQMLWEMVYADGELHEFEDNIVWRVAELLGISASDRLAIKRSVKSHLDEG